MAAVRVGLQSVAEVFADPDITLTTIVTPTWVSAGGEGEDTALPI